MRYDSEKVTLLRVSHAGTDPSTRNKRKPRPKQNETYTTCCSLRRRSCTKTIGACPSLSPENHTRRVYYCCSKISSHAASWIESRCTAMQLYIIEYVISGQKTETQCSVARVCLIRYCQISILCMPLWPIRRC